MLLVILKGGAAAFAAMIALFAAVGMHEFIAMSFPERKSEFLAFVPLGGAFPLLPVIFSAGAILPFLVASFFAVGLHVLFRFKTVETASRDFSLVISGMLYIPFLMSHLVMVRMLPEGVSWLLLIMLIVMTNDSAAYYVGSAIGRHRLYPQVSPKKSIEGAIGGCAGSICGALIARYTFFNSLSLADAVVTAVVVGIAGQLGDLFESLLKRSFGVKDSGTIIPGHGGVLDRLDSIIFAAPVTYCYAAFVFGRL